MDTISDNIPVSKSRKYTYVNITPENIELVKTLLSYGVKTNTIYNKTGISRYYINLIKNGVNLPIQNHRMVGPRKCISIY